MEVKKQCFTCGKGFSGDANQMLMHFKKDFEVNGTVRYFFRLNSKSPVQVCRAKDFNRIFKEKIKPNLRKKDHPEYGHISEYNPAARQA